MEISKETSEAGEKQKKRKLNRKVKTWILSLNSRMTQKKYQIKKQVKMPKRDTILETERKIS